MWQHPRRCGRRCARDANVTPMACLQAHCLLVRRKCASRRPGRGWDAVSEGEWLGGPTQKERNTFPNSPAACIVVCECSMAAEGMARRQGELPHRLRGGWCGWCFMQERRSEDDVALFFFFFLPLLLTQARGIRTHAWVALQRLLPELAPHNHIHKHISPHPPLRAHRAALPSPHQCTPARRPRRRRLATRPARALPPARPPPSVGEEAG